MKKNSEIIIIAAMAENRVIGKNNTLPWSFKEDMAHFKALTSGWPCIMGRKTWESLPKKPLPGRLNIIISKTMLQESVKDIQKSSDSVTHPNTEVKICESIADAIEYCTDYEKIFICGGASIYKEAFSLADRIELTLIRQNYDGDTFFPEIDPSIWSKINSQDFDNFSFISYIKRYENL